MFELPGNISPKMFIDYDGGKVQVQTAAWTQHTPGCAQPRDQGQPHWE